MELCFLKGDALDTLKNSLPQIFEKYFVETNNLWLTEIFGENPFVKFKEVPNFELTPLDKELTPGEIDLNNCKIIYRNFRFLTPRQAADERFWAGLCHGAFYDYVRRRWSYGDDKIPSANEAVKNIKSRFFFGGGSRDSLSTNTLAKCWWTGRALYDSNLENPFEKLDILGANNFYTKAFSIMTRSFAANTRILNGIIKFIKHLNDKNIKLSTESHLRPALSELNKNGGAVVLDCLTEEEIAAIMIEYVEKIFAQKIVVDDKRTIKPKIPVKNFDDTRKVKLGDMLKVESLDNGRKRNYKISSDFKKRFPDIFEELIGKKINSVVTIRDEKFKITEIG